MGVLSHRIPRTIYHLLLVTLMMLGLPCLAQEGGRPNIIVIISDDHPYQIISAYGSKLAKTPAIDRLATEGAIFQKAYVTNSICGPSRATFLTGKYSHKNGFRDNENSVFNGSQQTFTKLLNQAGYQTAWIGKWHLTSNPQEFNHWAVLPDQGRYYNPTFIGMDGKQFVAQGYASNVIEDFAEGWLEKRDISKPFCLVIGHKAPHRTWIPDTTDLGLYDKATIPLPANFYDPNQGRKTDVNRQLSIANTIQLDYDLKVNTQEFDKDFYTEPQRQRLKKYYQTVTEEYNTLRPTGKALTEWKYKRYMIDFLNTSNSVDRNVDRLLNYLDRSQLAKNTIVIYMSDQGTYLGEHGWIDKRWIYEESFRTPLLIRYAGVVKPKTSIKGMVLNLDIAPTLLELCGLAIPSDMQGKSMMSMLSGKSSGIHDAIYYHYYEPNHRIPAHLGIKTDSYKLIYLYDQMNEWEFYDLGKDPTEMRNAINERSYTNVIAKLRRQLDDLVKAYDDSEAAILLEKSVPIPQH